MVPTGGDERERLLCPREFVFPGHTKQTAQVYEVLRAPDIVARQHLHRDQMANPGDAHPEIWQELKRLSFGHYLRFDARRRE